MMVHIYIYINFYLKPMFRFILGMEGTVSSYSGGENLTLQFGSPINEMWSYPVS